jgi:hypothetical protein
MKKMIIIILLLFIITAFLSINFTFQASGSFREFEGDDDDHDDDSYNSCPSLKSTSQSTTLNIIWNKTHEDENEDVAQSIVNSSLGGFAIAATYRNISALYDNDDFSVIRLVDNGNLI